MNFASYDFWKLLILCFVGSRLILAAVTAIRPAAHQTTAKLCLVATALTHLFVDSKVILQPDWLEHLVPIELPKLTFLQLYRPCTEDLILTKMMRVDPQDRSDMKFLLLAANLNSETLEALTRNARIPDIPEIRQAFDANHRWLHQHLSSS